MPTIKCPHCGTSLQMRQAPASGKVKCPKCAKVITLKSSAGSAKATTAAKKRPEGAPVARQPAPKPDDDGFDFASLPGPQAAPAAALSQFPTAGHSRQVYNGPIPGDPLDAVPQDPDQDNAAAGGPTKRPAKKTSPVVLVGALAGVAVLIVAMVVGGVMFSRSRGSGESQVDALAELKKSAPEGYQAVGFRGCVALVPNGTKRKELPSVIGSDSIAVESAASGSVFFFGAMDGGTREIDETQMKKKAGRQLGGEVLGGTRTERNGYEGIRGKLDGSVFLPNMMVEAYQVDGRFIILGCAPASFEADPSVQMSVDRNLEQQEQDEFYESFSVGPQPSGWLF